MMCLTLVQRSLGNSRRRHNGHAARLAASCVALAPTKLHKDLFAWMVGLRQAYSRRHAFREEVTRAIESLDNMSDDRVTLRPTLFTAFRLELRPRSCTRLVLVATPTRNHNDAQHAPAASFRLSCIFASVPRLHGSVVARLGDFPVGFDEGGGLKNRCTFERKSWSPQVLISRTLSVCGEVAERLKAAVC
jgi:hypothetical protein